MEQRNFSDIESEIRELEGIAARLEDENLPVDEAIGIYADGLERLVKCRGMLKELTGRVEIIRSEAEERLRQLDDRSAQPAQPVQPVQQGVTQTAQQTQQQMPYQAGAGGAFQPAGYQS